MCSAILCETRWSQDPEGSPMSSCDSVALQPIQNTTEGRDVTINNLENGVDSVLDDNIKKPENLPIPPQYVTRQDSGVPEDLSSPCVNAPIQSDEDNPDDTINSDCNVTVIHISETLAESKDNKDGSDSGVEGCTAETVQTNGYAGSCNGLDEVSCDSSLVSCCSVYEDTCTTLPDDLGLNLGGGSGNEGNGSSRNLPQGNGEATSEGGSESSSIAGSTSAKMIWTTPKRAQTSAGAFSSSKKKVIKVETPKTSRGRPSLPADASHRLPSNTRSKSRTPATRTPSSKPQTSVKDKTKPREKSVTRANSVENSRESNTKLWNTQGTVKSRTRSRPIPDSLTLSGTSALAKEIDKDLAQRGRGTISSLSRCPSSASQKRTTPSSTPSEECRKSLSTPKINKTLTRSIQDTKKSNEIKNMENKTLDTYATMPRRNKGRMSIAKPEELRKTLSRDESITRTDKSKKRVNSRESTLVHQKSLSHCGAKTKYPERTLIYHETSVQTGLTGQDIEHVLAGLPTKIYGPDVPDRIENYCQTEAIYVSEETLKSVQDKVKKFEAEIASLQQEKEKLETKLITTEQLLTEERADHMFAKQELRNNAERILAILGTPASEHSEGSDSLLELESHFQESGQVVANQQVEIADLQSLCRILNRDLEKSLAAQKALLQHQQEVEAETMELQEFLQLEKTAMAEAMKEVEADLKEKEEKLAHITEELETKTEECKHLVRISEQRRQENLSLEMKLNTIERKSRELLLTQGAAVSGAAVALSGLGSRLEALVEQLVKSYNISEKDLEDVVYHNEAYSRSNSSGESSPISSKQHSFKDFSPSPKQNSFVSAVIGAIRNAATHPFVLRPTTKKSTEASKQQLFKELSMESSADLLDFETEPCLMMESVLEDVPLPDTYSRNMVSSSDSLRRALSVPEPITDDPSTLCRNDECSSLTNLTQAILNRRRVEENEDLEDDDECESISESETTGHTDVTVPTADYCTAVNLVDQVIDVDNFVTKLLKVLRIIQLDNDTCIRELRDEKCELEGKLAVEVKELIEFKKNTHNDLNSQCHNDKSNSNNCRPIKENEIISS
ncbi:rho-associated protein kinase 1 [Chelonus insularis]|uniref:rho-associated protein kinase 1 n=1 Tax=Chelonus insularis TaxID=460826 RepID=UPI00158A637F|nr:rho-associated protein kinase 1 [Chelonus insularis]